MDMDETSAASAVQHRDVAEHATLEKVMPLQSSIAQPVGQQHQACLLYTSPSPRDLSTSRMPSSA